MSDAVRQAWPAKPLGIRVSATDWIEGGWANGARRSNSPSTSRRWAASGSTCRRAGSRRNGKFRLASAINCRSRARSARRPACVPTRSVSSRTSSRRRKSLRKATPIPCRVRHAMGSALASARDCRVGRKCYDPLSIGVASRRRQRRIPQLGKWDGRLPLFRQWEAKWTLRADGIKVPKAW